MTSPTFNLLGSSFVYPGYGWRAPRWTHAHRYHVLYDDHVNLLLDVATQCDLFAELGVGALVLGDERVHDIAADVLGVLLSSDHPLAPHATARVSAAMAITSRDVPPDVELDVTALRPSDEESALIWDAKTTL